ncbi:hypothetical protein IE53DRAFT_250632 [Violaceomyces palustris]|uniref:Uncharacterized protein n=1 Tax=Violaceomyces palustris TaxID=1673888 RepID=A0ACD0P4D3_9BASI|nr:hypothetical protein IE53DRAFT_250632 [Violaceomyces palustris]
MGEEEQDTKPHSLSSGGMKRVQGNEANERKEKETLRMKEEVRSTPSPSTGRHTDLPRERAAAFPLTEAAVPREIPTTRSHYPFPKTQGSGRPGEGGELREGVSENTRPRRESWRRSCRWPWRRQHCPFSTVRSPPNMNTQKASEGQKAHPRSTLLGKGWLSKSLFPT